jgi:hypothetical protein
LAAFCSFGEGTAPRLLVRDLERAGAAAGSFVAEVDKDLAQVEGPLLEDG